MPVKPKITVIGAANIDLIGFLDNELIYKDSNIGTLETIIGGVGRNIAENLSRLGFSVEFLSVLADDEFSKTIIASCNSLNISTKYCTVLKNSKTSIYMAILDNKNDLALGLSAMDIYNNISKSFILNNLEQINKNKYCVLETNMPRYILELVTQKLPNIRFALDTVSADKALRAKPILNKLYILKCNLFEAKLLSDIEVTDEKDYKKLVSHFLAIGVVKVFITLGDAGVIYGDAKGIYTLKVEVINPVSTNGAGDSFMAGLLFGELKKYDIHKMVQFATACAHITIQHKSTVHPNLNEQLILKTIA